MNFTRIGKLSQLITDALKRKPTVVLNPEKTYRVFGVADNLNITTDTEKWEINDSLKEYIDELAKQDFSIEEKILIIYNKLCEEYTYDDNVLSYIRKNDDDTFYLPDEYGRDTDKEWKENRSKHNRRSCFEISRILAKSITELVRLTGNSKDFDICIFWDEDVTHYFVGLINKDYALSMDLDDFTTIKDLTRIKTGLTLDGIKVLRDPSAKISSCIREFNLGRERNARNQLDNEMKTSNSIKNPNELDETDFFRNAVQILKEEYNLDSAGIFEYLKEIVDTKLGARFRKKVWKEVEKNPGKGARYTRCLVLLLDDESYIVDVTQDDSNKMFRAFDIKELEKPESGIRPFTGLNRTWETDPYDGR